MQVRIPALEGPHIPFVNCSGQCLPQGEEEEQEEEAPAAAERTGSGAGTSTSGGDGGVANGGGAPPTKRLKLGKDPTVRTDFLPDKDREIMEEEMRQQLKRVGGEVHPAAE